MGGGTGEEQAHVGHCNHLQTSVLGHRLRAGSSKTRTSEEAKFQVATATLRKRFLMVHSAHIC